MNKPILGIEVKVCQFRNNKRSFYDNSVLPINREGISFTYFVKGCVRVGINNAVFVASAGDVVVIEPGEKYSFEAKVGTLVSYYNIGLAPVTNSGVILKRDLLGISPLCRPEKNQDMEELCKNLDSVFNNRNEKYHLQESSIIALRLFLLLKPLQEPFSTPEDEGRDNRSGKERIRDVLDYISLHYKDKLTVAHLAKKTGLHPSRFSRLFQEVTGVYPQRYIMEKKVMKAKDFLLVHNETLTATAAELGFHDYSHFYKAFIRVTGITPEKFLKNI